MEGDFGFLTGIIKVILFLLLIFALASLSIWYIFLPLVELAVTYGH